MPEPGIPSDNSGANAPAAMHGTLKGFMVPGEAMRKVVEDETGKNIGVGRATIEALKGAPSRLTIGMGSMAAGGAAGGGIGYAAGKIIAKLLKKSKGSGDAMGAVLGSILGSSAAGVYADAYSHGRHVKNVVKKYK